MMNNDIFTATYSSGSDPLVPTNIVRGGVFELSAFDLDGNQTNIVTATGEWAVEYNGENRPVRWHRAADDTSIRMAYDRMGRRVVKNDETFVYGDYLNVGKTIWDPTESNSTRPLVDLGGWYYYHCGNKNVCICADGADMVDSYNYSPFGIVTNSSDGDNSVCRRYNPFQYSSEYVDFDTSTVYFNYRHYIPVCGKWTSRDPIEELGGASLYLFTKNNFDTDQLGLMPRLGELLILSGALRRMGNNPIVKASGFGTVLIQTASCLYSLATVNQDPPVCVKTDNEQKDFSDQCVEKARDAVAGCVGNLGGAIGGVAGAGKGFLVAMIMSQIGKQLGKIIGDLVKDEIPEDFLKDSFCDKLPKVDPCCGSR